MGEGEDASAAMTFRFRDLGELSVPERMRHNLYKWGLQGCFLARKFRFNEPFSVLNREQFFAGLMEQPDVAKLLGGTTGPVRWIAKSCSALTTNFIDDFVSAGTIDRRQRFVERMPFFLENEEIVSRAQQLIRGVAPEDEEPPAAWLWREELLYTLWAVFVLGGHLAQFEDEVAPVREVCQFFYREMVDCRLRDDVPALNTQFYLVEEARGREWCRGTRDLLAVVVNPALRTCFLLLNLC